MINHKFNINDKVIFTNDFGVCWGVKTIIELDERCGKPTYHYADSDTPWFSVYENNFVLADEEDLKRLDFRENWDYFQTKYGWKPTLEQLGGCY
jgi:hypothetical protein